MIVPYASLSDLLAALSDTKSQTLTYFELSEEKLAKRYAPGKWTIRQLLHHITDAETVLYDRIRRTISKPGQVIWAFDQDAWEQGLKYESFPLTINRSIYSSTRDAVMYLAQQSYEALGHHPFVHNHTGTRSLRDEFDKVAWHNHHHLMQIQQALNL